MEQAAIRSTSDMPTVRAVGQLKHVKHLSLFNHIVIWVGRDFWRSSLQLPCNEQGHLQLDQVLRALSSLTLSVSRDGAPTTSLGNLCQCFIALTEKKKIKNLISSVNFPSLGDFRWWHPLPLASLTPLIQTPVSRPPATAGFYWSGLSLWRSTFAQGHPPVLLRTVSSWSTNVV